MMRYNEQNGAVSLFVVIFTALLLTVITISFVQLMLRDQQQATRSDLSQSAYDSAQAGVEDAKRLLLLNEACDNGTAGAADCTAIRLALASNSCDSVSTALGIAQTNGETLIQQDESDKKLDQAYTCVKVATNTNDYLASLEANNSQVIPLTGVGSFNTIEISWFTKEDFSGNVNQAVAFPAPGGMTSTSVELPTGSQANWPQNAPALVRAQLIQTGPSFNLSNFDDSAAGSSNANTLFLYPRNVGGLASRSFTDDARRTGIASAPDIVNCVNQLTVATYACSVTINLPNPIGGTEANRTALLRLSTLYNRSTFQVKLKNGATDVQFLNVQPEVDSTGRANDVFRRVKSRVTLGGEFPYPQAAIDIERDLCKNFTITNDLAAYVPPVCTP